MTEAQLWRRVEQITNEAKLRSFAEALARGGHGAMARRARERLGDEVGTEEDDGGADEDDDDEGREGGYSSSGGEGDEDEDGAGKENEGEEDEDDDDEAAAELALARRRVAELPPAKLSRLAGRVIDLVELKALIEALEEEGGNARLDEARERAWARLELLQHRGAAGDAGGGGGGKKAVKKKKRQRRR